MPPTPAIHTKNLHKTFLKGEHAITALQNIHLTINPGECVALMGHNGAGKSTLLRLLSGLIIPDKGHATVLGQPSTQRSKKKQHLGYMTPNERSFNWRLTGRQNLHYFATLCGLPKKTFTQRIHQWAETFHIDYLDQRFDRYSTGMRQHLALLRVMLHDPQLLMLDEPARSLDAASCSNLTQAITTLRDLNHTIIIATHLMPLAQECCTRLITMRNGAIEQDRGKPQWDRPPLQHTLLTSPLSSTEQETLNALPEIQKITTLQNPPASQITLTLTTGALQTVLFRCHLLGIHIWECNQKPPA